MQQLRWAIVGVGDIAQRAIAPAMVGEPQCRLVAVASTTARRARRFADQFGVVDAYGTYEQLLKESTAEAVFLATPDPLHHDQILAAAAAGKHVLCEKPMALSVADARKAVEACERAGVVLGVDFQNRFQPWVRDIAQAVADGRIGRVLTVEVEACGRARPLAGWRAVAGSAALGALYGPGVHALDLLRVILASEPVRLTSSCAERGAAVEAEVMTLLQFREGALAYVNTNQRNPYPLHRMVIYGEQGRIVGDNITRAGVPGRVHVRSGDRDATTAYDNSGAYRRGIAAFTQAVLQGSPASPSGIDGLRNAEMCAAIERSLATGAWVEVREGTSSPRR